MTIWFRSIIDVSEVMALDFGAGSVHEGQGQFYTAACCTIIDKFLSQIDPCVFASDETVQQLLREMEDLFTARFGRGLAVTNFIGCLMISLIAKGDRKRAMVRLRTVSSYKTHHFSTFRTGLALGLALPAAIDGIIRCESSNILQYSLSLFQASNLKRVLLFHRGGACFLYMRICWSQHFWRFSWAQTC